MAVRAQPAGTDTRDRLIGAAVREFSARGYKGASLRQICASAGVTTGALYFFFKSKEDLFRTIVSPVMGPLEEMLSRAVERQAALDRAAAEKGEPDAAEAAEAARAVAADAAHMTRDFLELCEEKGDVVSIMTRDGDNPVMELLVGELSSTLAAKIRERLLEPREGGDAAEYEFVASWLATTCVRSIIQIVGMEGSVEDAERRMGVIFNFITNGVNGL